MGLSDSRVFGHREKHLDERWTATDANVKQAATARLQAFDANFLASGYCNLFDKTLWSLVGGYQLFGGIASGLKCKIVPKDCYYQTTRCHIAEDHNMTFTTLMMSDLHTWCQHVSERLALQKKWKQKCNISVNCCSMWFESFFYVYTRAVRKVSSHFEYLENRSRGLDVTWQLVTGDLTAQPWSVSPMGLVSRQWDAVDWPCVLCDRRIHNDRASRSASSPHCVCSFYSSRAGSFC